MENAIVIFTCGFPELVILCMVICRKKIHIPERKPKWPTCLILQGHVMTRKLVWYCYVIRPDQHICLCAGSFLDFFPFSHCRQHYFVVSTLDFGEFKLFHDSIYWNLRELSLFILYVNKIKHDFASYIFYCICWLVPVATDTCTCLYSVNY